MAYDEQRALSRPAMHVEHDPRQYGRDRPVAFRSTPPIHSAVMSSPPTHAFAPPFAMAGPSRRPLPTPRPRPESMPPPLRDTPLVVQAPAPSRPAILATHPTSPTAPPARRPLPTPSIPSRPSTKHSSIDLTARPTSPVKLGIHTSPDHDLRIPSSFSRRTAPLPDSAQPPAALSTPPPHQSNFRNVTASFAPVGHNPIDPRTAVSARTDSPERRRPLPSSPAHHQRIPAAPEDEHDISSSSSPSDYEPITFADPLGTEEDEVVLARNRYGIRDLPSRSKLAIANRDDQSSVQPQTTRTRTARSATLPQPPIAPNRPSSTPFTSPSPSSPPPEPQSLTLRFASMGLAEDRERERQTQQAASGAQSPTRASPLRQQHGWPTSVPPLPRTPANTSRSLFGTADISMVKNHSNGTASLPTSPTHPARSFPSSPNPNATFDRKFAAQQSPQQSQSQQPSPLSEHHPQAQRASHPDINLDDAPPPSLRRSPSPIPGSARAPVIEITNDTPPRRQWTPGQDVTSRIGNPSASQSLEKRAQPQPSIPSISLPDDDGATDDNDVFNPSIVVSGPAISVSAPDVPAISVSEVPTPAISVSDAPPKISVADPSPSGSFGSRHTQIQEPGPSHSTPPRTGCKRGLPALPGPSTARTGGLSCGGCNGPIIGRIVSAMGQRWHPNCFRCTTCNELLEHVSSYERDGRPYCHLDYHETFAPRCFHCKTAIIDERFITLDDPALGKRTYHEQHFFCAECGDPFLAPSGPLPSSVARTGELSISGDGEFMDDDVGFTVYKGHAYCEACHVRLRMPKCKGCNKSIRDGVRAVEALGAKWCWGCFVCEGCRKPFEDPSFFLRKDKPFCEPCFSLMLRNDM